MKKISYVEIIASLFILLFVYTALNKLYDPIRFKWALGKSPSINALYRPHCLGFTSSRIDNSPTAVHP